MEYEIVDKKIKIDEKRNISIKFPSVLENILLMSIISML